MVRNVYEFFVESGRIFCKAYYWENVDMYTDQHLIMEQTRNLLRGDEFFGYQTNPQNFSNVKSFHGFVFATLRRGTFFDMKKNLCGYQLYSDLVYSG